LDMEAAMRACVLREGQLAVTEAAEPRPGPGQLLVRTLACGICGTDLHFARHAQAISSTTRPSGHASSWPVYAWSPTR